MIMRYLDPRRSRSVNICPSFLVHVQLHQFCIVIWYQFVIYYLSVVIHHLTNCFVFTFICSAQSFEFPSVSVLFILSHPIIDYSTTTSQTIYLILIYRYITNENIYFENYYDEQQKFERII
jgi:hypothetical protein